MISYKYNIYHSKKTKYLDKMLRECCFVWNHALALQRRYYGMFGKYIPVGKMKKHFTKRIKRNLLHSQTTQEILERLDESYNRFFKKLAKRPSKFKSPEKFNSFVFKQGGFTLNGNCLTINKGKKRFRFSYSRAYKGNIKQIRIVRETCSRFDKWYPSSKTCECGYVNKNLSLKDRTWVCSRCESVNDRDLLAAQNILRKGISELESMGNSSSRNTGVPCVCIQESHAL